VRHERSAEDGAGLVEAVSDEDFLRGKEAVEDVADGSRDVGELDAEADEDAEDEDGDEEFEGADRADAAVWAVKEENDECVGGRENATADKGDLWDEKVDCDSCADDLGKGVISYIDLVWIPVSKMSRRR
jgi:hypothetical protein